MSGEPSDTAFVATGIDPASSGTSVDDSAALFDALESQQGQSQRSTRRQAATDDDARGPTVDDVDDNRRALPGSENGEDDLDNPDRAGEHDDEDDEWPEDLRERKFRRTINGQRVEVTLAELENGYHRQADYTRKMQEVAQQRTAFEQGARATLAQREQLDQGLRAVQQIMQASLPQEPDWVALAANPDPRVLTLAQLEWGKQQQKLAHVATMIQANQAAGAQEWQQAYAARMADAFDKMLEANPDWKDPKVRAKGQAEIAEYTASLGFTQDDLKGIVDPRIIGVLRDAANYRKALKAMQQRRREGTQSDVDRQRQVRPADGNAAQRPPSRNARAAQEDRNRLRKSGSLQDAAKVFERLV
jgi:hypothetical protein